MADSQTPNPEASSASGLLPASHWLQVHEADKAKDDESDTSSLYSEANSSTASVASSILRFRTLHGRTYHSEIGIAQSWTPNDSRHTEYMDYHHAVVDMMLGGKLHLTPLDFNKVKKVLDVGTGTGAWAIDFADAHPDVEVIGTDITPIQPTFVPPNLRFEIDDANLDWTFRDNTFDYIHIRFLVGCIADWYKLFREAFRTLKPGGWLETHEPTLRWVGDRPIDPKSATGQFHQIFWEAGKKFGRTFRVFEEEIQKKAMEAAGFVNIMVTDIRCPIGSWPEDPEKKELGTVTQVAFLGDLDGYLLYLCSEVLGWTAEETHVYCARVRRELLEPGLNPCFIRRIVSGRKPEAA